jgi:PX domain
VERRYNDFLWLRNYLVKEFPALYIPPMAPQGVKNSNESHIEKRMEQL